MSSFPNCNEWVEAYGLMLRTTEAMGFNWCDAIGFGQENVAAEHDLFDEQVHGVSFAMGHIVLHSGDQVCPIVKILADHQAVYQGEDPSELE